jgi:hypothetical protein
MIRLVTPKDTNKIKVLQYIAEIVDGLTNGGQTTLLECLDGWPTKCCYNLAARISRFMFAYDSDSERFVVVYTPLSKSRPTASFDLSTDEGQNKFCKFLEGL